MVAPEYGGDNVKRVEAGKFPNSLVAFPGHWAPLQMAFYSTGSRRSMRALPRLPRFWNRVPKPGRPQRDLAFDDKGMPRGTYEVFDLGFRAASPCRRRARRSRCSRAAASARGSTSRGRRGTRPRGTSPGTASPSRTPSAAGPSGRGRRRAGSGYLPASARLTLSPPYSGADHARLLDGVVVGEGPAVVAALLQDEHVLRRLLRVVFVRVMRGVDRAQVVAPHLHARRSSSRPGSRRWTTCGDGRSSNGSRRPGSG